MCLRECVHCCWSLIRPWCAHVICPSNVSGQLYGWDVATYLGPDWIWLFLLAIHEIEWTYSHVMCWVCWREFHLPFVNEMKWRLERWSMSWTSVIPSLRESIKLGKIGWSCATDVCARMVDRWSIMDICLLWVRLKQDKDRSYGTIRLTGHSWARNSRQGVSMYRIQGTSRYIYILFGNSKYTWYVYGMYLMCMSSTFFSWG